MKPGGSTLLFAGIAGIASVMLASASLTIAIIAATHPPVSQYNAAVINPVLASNSRMNLGPAILTLVLGLWAIVNVVLRREVTGWRGWSRSGPSNTSLKVMAVLLALVMALTGRSVLLSINAIRLAGDRPLTDSMSFGGMSLPLGLMSMMLAVMSHSFFSRWQTETETPSAVASPTLSPPPLLPQ